MLKKLFLFIFLFFVYSAKSQSFSYEWKVDTLWVSESYKYSNPDGSVSHSVLARPFKSVVEAQAFFTNIEQVLESKIQNDIALIEKQKAMLEAIKRRPPMIDK